MVATAAEKLRDKFTKLFAMLGSSIAGEREVARCMIDDLLAKNQKNWNDLTELLSTGNAHGWLESGDTGGAGSVDESSLTGPAKASRRRGSYRGAQRTRARVVLRRIYRDENYPTEEEVSSPDLWILFCKEYGREEGKSNSKHRRHTKDNVLRVVGRR
jgi:hypothetical protein